MNKNNFEDLNVVLHEDQETIVAQSTPCNQNGAIAIVRLSGKNAIKVVSNFATLSSGKNLLDVETHTINYGWVTSENKQKIDQVLFLLMKGPKTFTGQDTVEITCHNNQFLIQKIIDRAIECGARIACNGEFTKRAFFNGKIDLIQAEAINELIKSQTQTAIKSSLQQIDGSLSAKIKDLEDHLIKAHALSEASFEFIEDEEIQFLPQIKDLTEKCLNQITQLKKTFDNQKQIREGIRIAIIGAVNAGKSSLFNALTMQKKAIVTNIAGTTRDAIEANIIINSNNATLIDTAGLRQTDNQIELAGIEKSFEQAQIADIVLLVFDSSRNICEQEANVYIDLVERYHNKIIFIANKCDALALDFKPHEFLGEKSNMLEENLIFVSSLENKNLDRLEKKISDKINNLFTTIEAPFLINKRQFNLLSSLEQKLFNFMPLLNKNPEYEIISYMLKDAVSNLSEITGKTISNTSIDLIFKEFCVGK